LQLVGSGRRVAVLAVDPSSGISGGSILGDKTRMPELSAALEAYIRPSPSAGTLGGVASRTRESLLVCEAAGYQVILIETVGVGQSETMVADMTDCFLALMLPGAGDELQGIKRGLLELVDVIAVNKADGETRKAAARAAHQYDMALMSLSDRSARDGPPDVVTCSALQREGVDVVWQAIERRYTSQLNDGTLVQRRGQQNLSWLWSLVEQQLRQAIRGHAKVWEIRHHLERDVVAGVIPPKAAARQIIEAFGLSTPDLENT
jgi:LAO/AO transport system kinase